jgi:hypothetical protein
VPELTLDQKFSVAGVNKPLRDFQARAFLKIV